jgi:mediator of RNA polymerase II transcription subunit 17
MFQEQKVPRSSLGLVKEAIPDEDPSQLRAEEKARRDYTRRRQALAMKGSRMDALDWATDTLLKAATNLESTIRNETKYWDEILSISDQGWQMQRTRRGVRNAPYAVKYGPLEGSLHRSTT